MFFFCYLLLDNNYVILTAYVEPFVTGRNTPMSENLKLQSPPPDAVPDLLRCNDIYEGLDRLLAMQLPYVILDNIKQYQIMCMQDKWIEGRPIQKTGDGVRFDYECQGAVYRIKSFTSKQDEVMFFNIGNV